MRCILRTSQLHSIKYIILHLWNVAGYMQREVLHIFHRIISCFQLRAPDSFATNCFLLGFALKVSMFRGNRREWLLGNTGVQKLGTFPLKKYLFDIFRKFHLKKGIIIPFLSQKFFNKIIFPLKGSNLASFLYNVSFCAHR